MSEITIKTKKQYRYVVEDSFVGLTEEIARVYKGCKLYVVYDKNTAKLFKSELRDELCGYEIYEYVVPIGEQCKSFSTYKRLIDRLLLDGMTRNDMLVAVGGGAVSDLVGFLAATYMRGVSYSIISTTLLSAVDASIGGKTAIDSAYGKNITGAFHAPSLVYVNTACFESLPVREKESGMGEIAKYALLSCELTDEILKGDISDLCLKCADIKRAVVEKDEFERKAKGGRKILNLGHTIGHALEASCGYSLSHGFCVAYGLNRIIDLSVDFYGLNSETKDRMKSKLNVYPFDFNVRADIRDIKSGILFDKKTSGDKISFILLKDVGCPSVENISIADMWRILK